MSAKEVPLNEMRDALRGRSVVSVEVVTESGEMPYLVLGLDDGSTLYANEPTLYANEPVLLTSERG